MNICGIVAEYNPFHAGHALHIARTRAQLGDRAGIICVLSGSFVQRGEATVFSPLARAEAAVRCGADLVLELPLPWALSSAEFFARGAVALLAATGVADYLSFGSECGNLSALQETAALLLRPELNALLRENLTAGLPYAAARQAAAETLAGKPLPELRSPNDILGVEYCKALTALGAPLSPLAVPRFGAAHDTQTGVGCYRSAAALRQALASGETLHGKIPAAAEAVFARETQAGRGPVLPEGLDTALLSRLRALPRGAFAALPDAAEGLENRLFRAAREAPTFAAAVAMAGTKRYPAARVRRMFCAAALGLQAADRAGPPPYLRPLAFNAAGQALLARMRKSAALPIVTKPAAARGLSPEARRIFALEADAADLYALGFPDPAQRVGGQLWRTTPVRVV
ncbi:MAG: nucleotidyltransferase family protein [Oscillospiraceae bacterium]|nr:nucleotidyltransferase family protein [Oscillospiraceae bacterium]